MTDPDFRSFLMSERKKFVHYVRSLVKETAELEAEDIVHDVLIKMLERADLIAPMEFSPAYIYRSLRNRVIDTMRTTRELVSLDAEPPDGGPRLIDLIEDDGPGALEMLQTQEGRAALFEALGTLGIMERKVIIAHEFEGIPYKDLSDDLGVPVNTLLSHKRRGMKKLQEQLSDSEGDS